MNIDPAIIDMFASGGFVLYGGVFLIGMIYGLTTCTFSCLPVVGTYIVSTRSSFSGGVKATLIFSIAKVAGYTAMGVLCGLLGNIAKAYLSSPVVLAVCGSVMLLIGVFLLFSKQTRSCSTGKCSSIEKNCRQNSMQLSLLGLVMSFIPCLPYTAIMAGAAASGSAFQGGTTAFLFGLGTVLSPLLLFGGALGWLAGKVGEQVPAHTHIIRKIGVVMIIFMGGRIVLFSL